MDTPRPPNPSCYRIKSRHLSLECKAFCFFWYWGLNSGPHTCQVGTLCSAWAIPPAQGTQDFYDLALTYLVSLTIFASKILRSAIYLRILYTGPTISVFVFWDRILLCSPGWPQNHNSLASALSASITGMRPHAQIQSVFILKGTVAT
jgi:hypothetical protein